MKILFQILALIIVYIKGIIHSYLMKIKENSSSQLSTNNELRQSDNLKKSDIKDRKSNLPNLNKFANLYQKRNITITNTSTITYRLKLFWKEEIKLRETIQGSIAYHQNLTEEEAKVLIFVDLHNKGKQIKKGAKLFVKFRLNDEVYNKQSDLQQEQMESEHPAYVQSMLIQSKINLPQGYKYLPATFEGFIIKNLSISNQFGTITWNSPVDISNVDFSQGIHIKVNSIQCSIPALQKDVLVQFYYLNHGTLQYLQKHGKHKLMRKMRRCVDEMQCESCRLIFINEANWHWFVHIILSKN